MRMRTLNGKRVALLEGRQSQELAAMVSRLGGLPICAPALREVSSGADARPILARVIAGEFRMLVVLTGAGATALFKEAERYGLDGALRERLKTTTIVCRGPKPLTALKRYGISAELVTAKPHTTADLIEALASVEIAGLPIALLHYGELSPACSQALSARGAVVEDVCLYEWALPDDVTPLRDLVSRVVAGTVDALLFTSQIQFRHLMQIAEAMGNAAVLRDRLNEDIVVAAVGPVCAAALRDGGVVPDVLPASPNSASLVNALGDYFDLIMKQERSVDEL
jgi:uroporphyrinogen-III synthase